jgi:hypothetical protein
VPFTYTRDDDQRRIEITFTGKFGVEDSLAAIERRRTEPDGESYGVLYDLRELSGYPTVADLKRFMSADAPSLDEPKGNRRGPMAILVTDPALYGMACTYRALGQSKLVIEVFRDRDDADAWLKTSTKVPGA